MTRSKADIAATTLASFGPPYNQFVPITLEWKPQTIPPVGHAIVWWIMDGSAQQEQYEWLDGRPFGLPLFIVLPPPDRIVKAMPLLNYVTALHPRAILPGTRIASPANVRALLAAYPRNMPDAIATYLMRRGLLTEPKMQRCIRQIFASVPTISNVSGVARRLFTSRRTLGRHFAAAGLPVASHWLQFARLLLAIMRLQTTDLTISRVALRMGYPDGFTMSNQMKRIIGLRPSEVRTYLGWEWVVETWLYCETISGNVDAMRYEHVIRPYL